MGNLWSIAGAFLLVAALGLVYSWKLEADRAADLEAQLHRLEQRIQADDAAIAKRDKARTAAERKAKEQRDEIQKDFQGLDDDELLCRLHGLCAKGANQGNPDAASGKLTDGMPAAPKAGGHE